jgi:hypothetical protein
MEEPLVFLMQVFQRFTFLEHFFFRYFAGAVKNAVVRLI